jgi:hypothetical protein
LAALLKPPDATAYQPLALFIQPPETVLRPLLAMFNMPPDTVEYSPMAVLPYPPPMVELPPLAALFCPRVETLTPSSLLMTKSPAAKVTQKQDNRTKGKMNLSRIISPQ